jgi:hypothetical protein
MTDRYGSANAAATDYRDKEVMQLKLAEHTIQCVL